MKYVRNACYGGFSLSDKAVELYNMYAGTEYEDTYSLNWSTGRNDPNLVRVVEELGKEANGECAELLVVEIPNDVNPILNEYDGWERFEEPHRTW
jgi:hypothetical protein